MSLTELCYSSADAVLTSLRSSIASHLKDIPAELDIHFLGEKIRSYDPDCSPEPNQKRQLLAVRVTPLRVYLSCFSMPLFRTVAAPCPECLDRRLWSVLTLPEQHSMTLGFELERNDSPYLFGTVLENVSLLAKRIVALDRNSSTSGHQVFAVDLVSQEITISELMADSFCRQCQSQEPVSAEAAHLQLRDKVQARSGKSRMKGLIEYRLPVKALINPVCGAVGLNAVPGYAQSVTAPVYGQYSQRAYSVEPRIVAWSGLCTRTDESRTAGILEALERQAGMLAHPARTAVIDSYRNLGKDAMDPALCLSYNEECFTLPLGLSRYSPDLPLEWIWGFSLTSKRPILVPKQMVFYDRIAKERIKVIDNCSSGCALGSCYEEAILRGLLELLERDSFVIAWYRKLALPRIDPQSCTDRKTRLILDRVKYLGYNISLLDARLDLKIPAVIAIGRRPDDDVGAMVVGASASTDSTEAVRGALLEAATSVVEMPAMVRTKQEHVRALAANYYLVKTVSDHAMLYGLPEMAEKVKWIDGNPLVRTFHEAYPPSGDWHSSGDIAADLSRCISELARCGLNEVIAVDLTTREQRELDLKTARVIVPGLAPIDFGFPRNRVERLPRLYSAPAAAGLSPVGEDVINPLPHPFP